ncbi:MAG: hypothetical protein HY327_01535 [Chloroflexi bacterium]|nr:hypothetical protein [Chloroflexota bacterium]
MKVRRGLQIASGLFLWVMFSIFATGGCNAREQSFFQTEVARGGETGIVLAQTEVVKAAQTGIVVAQTQAAQFAQTSLAESANLAATQVAQLKQTAVAKLTQAARKQSIDYFALGDSIASGHGLMDDGTSCHRSTRAYPYKVAQLLRSSYREVNFDKSKFLACSGASAGQPDSKTLKDDKYKWFRNQVDDVLRNLSDRPTLVSITIGANDFGWANPSVLLKHSPETADVYVTWVNKTADGVSQELRGQVNRLLERPNVTVVITEVYNPINKSSLFFTLLRLVGKSCNDWLGTLQCYERSDYLIQGLNNAYILDVFLKLGRPKQLGIANSNPRFYGHEAPQPTCGSSAPGIADTWIQYPGDVASNSQVPDLLAKITKHKFGDCFHANEKGAQAIAEAVIEKAMGIIR